MRDIKDALRGLRASRGATVVALTLLTLGIGASTAIYSVVDAVLRGLPFPDADRLVAVSGRNTTSGTTLRVPPQDYVDWKARQHVFDDLAAAAEGPDLIASEGERPETVVRTRVTASLFNVLRVQPRIGRGFTPDNEVPGRHLVLLLSDALWKSRFGGDPSVLGRTMAFETGTYEIVGVMPPGFSFPLGAARPADVYTPYVVPASQRARGQGRSFALEVIGRLAPGVTLDQARAGMDQLHRQLATEYPDWFYGRGIGVAGLRESLIGEARPWMQLLVGAVGVLLLLVSVNLSGLSLARGLARSREIGIRAALGATRWQIARMILVENLVLTGVGASLGALLAHEGVGVLRAWIPASLPRVATVAVDSRILAAAVLCSLLTAVLCSILPALTFSRADVARTLREGGRSDASAATTRASGTWLVAVEVALSAMLLVAAGLFVASFTRVMRVDLGLDYHDVLTVPAHVRSTTAEARTRAFARAKVMVPEILERVRAIPGVQGAAAIAGGVPLSRGGIQASLQVRGRATQLIDEVVDRHQVSADYFRVLRIPLLKGRLFSPADTPEAAPVVILSESAARTYFPDGDALGATIGLELETDLTVVGVVADVRLDGPERDRRPEAYVLLHHGIMTGADIVVRTAGNPVSVAPAVKAAIWSVEPSAVIPDTPTLEMRLARLIAPRRFNMLLFTVLGLFALAVAATGIYGLLAQHVEQRTHEIGVRIALGAMPGQIVGLVVGRASRYVAGGLASGVAGAWVLSRFVEAFLFETTAYDGRSYISAGLLLVASGLAAAFVPARRAARLDPAATLKAS